MIIKICACLISVEKFNYSNLITIITLADGKRDTNIVRYDKWLQSTASEIYVNG